MSQEARGETSSKIHGGTVHRKTKNMWINIAREEGFTSLWPWIHWVLSSYQGFHKIAKDKRFNSGVSYISHLIRLDTTGKEKE